MRRREKGDGLRDDDDDVEEEEEELVYYLFIFVWFSIFTSGRLCVCI